LPYLAFLEWLRLEPTACLPAVVWRISVRLDTVCVDKADRGAVGKKERLVGHLLILRLENVQPPSNILLGLKSVVYQRRGKISRTHFFVPPRQAFLSHDYLCRKGAPYGAYLANYRFTK